ncbi:pseudouridine synthase [Inquilinus sp. Marseille-Q2685]|uniref:pseudouridine synthase n=1 Tax=Inquilinus sp. Marseille-Q2685 TaxID=2866581 RepID=UPI001CE475C9|nr:pseudouridine synthase [Inquilinus sp. Marseille-Q2685]
MSKPPRPPKSGAGRAGGPGKPTGDGDERRQPRGRKPTGRAEAQADRPARGERRPGKPPRGAPVEREEAERAPRRVSRGSGGRGARQDESEPAAKRRPPRDGKRPGRIAAGKADDERAPRRATRTGPAAPGRRPPPGKTRGPRSKATTPQEAARAAMPEWLWDGEEPVEEAAPRRRGRPRGPVPEERVEPAEAPAARTRPRRPLTSSRRVAGDAPAAKPGERWREERRKRPTPEPDQCRYVVFHKPYGVLSQFTPEGRWRGLNEFGLPPGIYAAGRLDADSEGLLLLTDDGPLIKRLLDPKQGHPRTYLAQVEGDPAEEALAVLAGGIALTDGPTRPCGVERLAEEPDLPPRDPPIRTRRSIPTAWLRLTLTEGRNRQVRRMTAAVGHPTLRLVRIALGGLALGDLAPGTWSTVERSEILSGLR